MTLLAVPFIVTSDVLRLTVDEVTRLLILTDGFEAASELSVNPAPALSTIATWLMICFAMMFTGEAVGTTSSVEPTIRSEALKAASLLWSALTLKVGCSKSL